MTCTEVEQKIKQKQTPVKHILRNHCDDNNHCLYYFLPTQIFEKDNKVTTLLVIQRELIDAINLFEGVIPLHYFEEYICKNKPLKLLTELAKVMGAAVAAMSSQNNKLHNLRKSFDKKDVASKLPKFKEYCVRKMKEICHALLTFDYMSLAYEGMELETIWNATNLFFRQGLFFERVFPPIMFVKLESLEITQF